jgi:hypothetical protein
MSSLETVLSWLVLAASAALSLRLLLAGLVSVYPALFAYLVIDTLQALVGVWMGTGSSFYLNWFTATQALKVIIYVLITRELFGETLRGFPALATLGRRSILIAGLTGIAAAAALDISAPPADPSWQRAPQLHVLMSAEKSVTCTLAICLVFYSVFLFWFPVRVRRNVIVYASGFIIYFAAKTVIVFSALVLGSASVRGLSTGVLAINLACLAFWIVQFSSTGELEQARPRRLSPEDEELVISRLQQVNRKLENLSGKPD